MNAMALRHRGSGTGNRRAGARRVARVQRFTTAVCCLLATLAGARRVEAAAPARVFSDQPPAASLRPPGVAPALAAFQQVDAFIHAGTELSDAGQLPPVAGCSVVLRLAGEIVGRATEFNAPGTPPSPSLITAAARAAWAEAERKLPVTGAPQVRAEKTRLLRQDLLVSVELAGAPLPLTAGTFAQVDASLQPGIDGVLVVIAGKSGATFPGAAAAGGLLPADALRRATSGAASAARGETGDAAALTLLEPEELTKKHGAAIYTFRTTHFAQFRADKPPELLYRGQKLVLNEDIDALDELWYMADRLAGNLVNRTFAQPPGGMVQLSTGDADEPTALGSAIARHALLEYSNRCASPEKGRQVPAHSRELITRTHDAATLYLKSARDHMAATDESGRLAASAMILWHADSKVPPEEGAVKSKFTDDVLIADIPPGMRGLLVWGNGVWPRETSGRPTDGHPMAKAVRALMAQTAIPALPGEMPWLGWIDLNVDRAANRPVGSSSAAALREMRTLIWKHQLQSIDAGPDRQDMVGGIAVPGSPDPLPTWQTARLVAFLGTMLGEPELTSKTERPAEIVRLLNAARFLRQLQVDDAMGWMCKDPVLAKGGIRAATWDQHVQTDSTAMTLLAVLEIIDGLEKAAAAKP